MSCSICGRPATGVLVRTWPARGHLPLLPAQCEHTSSLEALCIRQSNESSALGCGKDVQQVLRCPDHVHHASNSCDGWMMVKYCVKANVGLQQFLSLPVLHSMHLLLSSSVNVCASVVTCLSKGASKTASRAWHSASFDSVLSTTVRRNEGQPRVRQCGCGCGAQAQHCRTA